MKLFDILENLYQKTSLTFEEALVTFLVTSGVRQGGPESPCLFNLYIDFVMRIFMSKCASDHSVHFFKHRYRINARSVSREYRLQMRQENRKLWGTSFLPWSGYADDLILFMLDIPSLQKAATLLDEVFISHGLSINVSKTETMILNHTNLNSEYPKSIINLRNEPLQNSMEFKYLGSLISQNEPNTGEIEINHRIQMAHAKFASMSNLLQNSAIYLKTRIKFLNSFVRSRLTYSCQNWNLTNSQFQRLDVTYRTLLRRMIRGGFKRIDYDDGDFRYKITNDKLHEICKTSDVSNFIRLQQKRYAGHVIRMPIERNAKQLMFDDEYHRVGRATPSLLEQVAKFANTTIDSFINFSLKR